MLGVRRVILYFFLLHILMDSYAANTSVEQPTPATASVTVASVRSEILQTIDKKAILNPEVVNQTYSKALPCILQSWMYENGKGASIQWKFPDDAQTHFEEILNRTAKFRVTTVHEYSEYAGPWIENIFISTFIDMPLSYFRGFIPIFVQWIDTEIIQRSRVGNILAELNQVLRPNVLYLAVSQGDIGLREIGRSHPNILVLSAGGYGHVPIPLVKSEIPWSPQPATFQQDIGFFGKNHHARPAMMEKIKTAADALNMTFRQALGPTWKADMEMTKFNLAPRGYGRNSFRFSESIQLGRVPVLLYDDIAWHPYQGTNLDILTYGFMAGLNEQGNLSISHVVGLMKNLTQEAYALKVANLAIARPHFTYPGIIKQIHMLLQDPFGPHGGQLRCTVHPRTERCCGRRRR